MVQYVSVVSRVLRVQRCMTRLRTQELSEQCGSKGVEALHVTVSKPIFFRAITLHGLVPDDTPIMIYLDLAAAQAVDSHKFEDLLSETRVFAARTSGVAGAWQDGRRETRQRAVRFDTSGWVEIWRGVASAVKVGADILHIKMPSVEVVGAAFRLAACGAWSLSAVDNSSIPSYLQHAQIVEIEGYYGSNPSRVPGGKLVYVPAKGIPGSETFSFRASDGSLESEHTGAVTVDTAREAIRPWAGDMDVYVRAASSTPIEIQLPPAVRSASPPTFKWQITQAPDKGELSLDGEGSSRLPVGVEVSSQSMLYFRAPDPATGGVPYTSLRYKVRIADGAHSAEGVVRINVVCAPGQELRRPLPSSDVTAEPYTPPPLVCTPCEPGSFNPGNPLSSRAGRCQLCTAGSYQPARGATACMQCASGKYSALPADTTCHECGAGTFAPAPGSSRCEECAAGEMMPLGGSTNACFACGMGAYNSARGRPLCKSCPALARALDLRSDSQLDCLCTVGTFDTSGCPGVECQHCPTGAMCYGGRNAPAANAGYWSDAALWLNGTQAEFMECNFRSIRDNCRGVADYMNPLPGFLLPDGKPPAEREIWGKAAVASFLPHAHQQPDMSLQDALIRPPLTPEPICRTDNHDYYSRPQQTENGCLPAYQGRFCSVCTEGHAVSLDGSCDACPGDHPVIFFFAVIFVLTAFGLLIHRLIRRREAEMLFIFWAQNVATLIHWTWPMPAASKTVLALLTLFNLNHHILPWACYSMGAPWVSTTLLLACLPWVSVCSVFLAARGFKRYVYHQTGKGKSLLDLLPPTWRQDNGYDSVAHIAQEQDAVGSRPSSASAEAKASASRPTSVQSQRTVDSGQTVKTSTEEVVIPEWEKRLQQESIRLALVMCDVFLVPSCLAALQLLDCSIFVDATVLQRERESSGKIYLVPRADLTAYPDFECWTVEHIGAFFLGTLSVLFNMLAFPGYLFYHLAVAFLEEQMQEARYVRAMGEFYQPYEHKYWWWHAVVLLRRLVFVAVAVQFSSFGYFQLLVSMAACSLSILLSVLLRPYKDNRYNLFDLLLNAAALILISSAIANTMSISIARALVAYEWAPAMLFWVVTLLALAASLCFVSNLHPVEVPVPEQVVAVLRAIAGPKLEDLATKAYEAAEEYRQELLVRHPFFKVTFFPLDLPAPPKKERPPPPLTAEEEYLATLQGLGVKNQDEDQRTPSQRAAYDSASAVKSLGFSQFHNVQLFEAETGEKMEAGWMSD